MGSAGNAVILFEFCLLNVFSDVHFIFKLCAKVYESSSVLKIPVLKGLNWSGRAETLTLTFVL